MADPEIVDESKEKGKKGQDAKEKETKDGAAAPKKQGVPLNPMVIAAAAAVVLAVGGAFFLVKALSSQTQKPEPPPAAAEGKTEGADAAGKKEEPKAHGAKKEGHKAKKEGHGGKKEGEAEESPFFNFERPLVVNIAQTNGERYLKTDLVLQLDPPELAEEIRQKKPQLLDMLIEILSSKTLESVCSAVGKNMIKQEMIDKINALLETGRVVNIFFNEFVVQ